MDALEDTVDYLIVDTGAGINENVMYFNLAAQERLIILTPEPTSLTDAYALIKVMQQNHDVNDFRVLVNLAADQKSALDIFRRLYRACDYFLAGVGLDYVGMIPRDAGVRKAVIQQKPFCEMDPEGPACQALSEVAKTIQTWNVPHALDGNIKFFWKRLLFRQ
jgi:flagellar biosynthesis protein FlhG